jgi:hypothetical protein
LVASPCTRQGQGSAAESLHSGSEGLYHRQRLKPHLTTIQQSLDNIPKGSNQPLNIHIIYSPARYPALFTACEPWKDTRTRYADSPRSSDVFPASPREGRYTLEFCRITVGNMLRSQLSDTLRPTMGSGDGEAGEETVGTTGRRTASRSPSKARSLSDGGPPTLSPSPKFREPEKKKAQDDSALSDNPTTPRRPAFPLRGLSLQMPARDLMSPSTQAYISRVPLSPKLDHSQTYGSPSSVLPRRSRGLDFSRAATNLHHSTLAEQSSPDSSPTIGGRAMNIPNRKNGLHFSSNLESMNNNSSSLWSTMANADRMVVSSSLGSVNMLGSESSGSSSDEDDLMDADDIDDSILSTPQINKMSGPFSTTQPSPGNGWVGQSPAVSSLMNFQRARLRHGKSRKSSSSGSGNSMASPKSKSPPTMRSLENMNTGYFGGREIGEGMQARRESISWAANQLHISGSESDDGTLKSTLENVDGMPITPGRDGQRGVIRRAVTRRGNMLVSTGLFIYHTTTLTDMI